jgi:hypothetical protein
VPADWRLQGQERYLQGALLRWTRYERYSPSWDHDHCAFCWAKFAEQGVADALHEGYATDDRYRWICSTCFNDLRQQFGWRTD